MNEKRVELLIRDLAQAYHRPAEPPRREIWLRLQAARAARAPGTVPLPRRRLHPLAGAAGIAAVLAIGIGLGRWSVRPPEAAPAIAAAGLPPSNAAYRMATVEHLGQAEVFLTLFRMSVRRGTTDPRAPAAARRILVTNRLLLDSPVGADSQLRALLEDLELVLARIAQLSPQPSAEDIEMITAGMEQISVMPRLRSEVPAGPGLAGTQGAL